MPAISEAVQLNSGSRATLIEVIESTLPIETPAQFIAWTQGALQTLLPHRIFVGGVGQIGGNGFRVRHLLSRNLPAGCLQAITRPNGEIASPVIARWRRE